MNILNHTLNEIGRSGAKHLLYALSCSSNREVSKEFGIPLLHVVYYKNNPFELIKEVLEEKQEKVACPVYKLRA